MNIIKIKKSFSNNNGFTYFDVLIYIAIVSILSLTTVQMISQSFQSLRTYHGRAEAAKNKILLYSYLEREFSKIAPPWWIPYSEPEIKENEYKYHWYNGKKDETLLLRNHINGIVIIRETKEDSTIIFKLSGLRIENIETYSTTENIPSGYHVIIAGNEVSDSDFYIPFRILRL